MYAYKEQERVSFNKKKEKGAGGQGATPKLTWEGVLTPYKLSCWKMGEFSSQASCCFGTEGILDRIAGCQEYFWSLLPCYPGLNHLYILSIYSQKNDIWYMFYSEYQNIRINHIITWIKISNFNTELLSSFFEMPVFLWKTWTKIKTRWPLQEKIIIIK